MADLQQLIASMTPQTRALLAQKLGITPAADDAWRREPIAVVGLSGRFPGADGVEALWRLLERGGDAVTEVPRSRWDNDAFFDADPDVPGKMTSRFGGFVADVDRFDHEFFGVSPREAVWLDPQHRLLLELAWEALEDAGLPRERLSGTRAGVFMGMASTDYVWLAADALDRIDAYSSTGNAHSVAVGRVSYLLDLRGPAVAVDTACSSSLVSVHMACQSLRSRETDLALAGGIHLTLSPGGGISFAKWGVLSPDGRCKAFDARADGIVRGEGAGVLALKRLADARRDGDRIWAVIRGTAVNQDGRSSGLTAPNVAAQEAVLAEALANAGLSPADVDLVETHGTGTSLGDPIELEAIKAVYGRRPADRPLHVGALKTNLGHLEAAAGVAGLIKAVLCLRARAIPANLHFRRLNPAVSLDGVPLAFPTAQTAWPAPPQGAPRRAGVSAFGFGGTNSHVVVEEAPAPEAVAAPAEALERPALLVASARTPAALAEVARRLAAQLRAGGAPLADVLHTAALRRSHLEHRVAIVGRDRGALAERLEAFATGEAAPGIAAAEAASAGGRKVAFVFPGQGSQWLGMGRELLAREPVFREAVARCDAAIRAEAGWSVLDELSADADRSRLARIDVAQPVLFALQVGLSELWRSLGVRPAAVIGHSMGEVAAAHVAGALSLADAAAVICRRSVLLGRIAGKGAMAVVELSLEEARQAIAGHEAVLAVAASNAPRSSVLAGDPAALAAVGAQLEARGDFFRMVKVDVASHSPQVEPLTPDLLAALSGIAPRAGEVPILSTVDDRRVDGAAMDARYWVRNLREPVRFAAAVERALDEGIDAFVELSAHPLLTVPVEETVARVRGGAGACAVVHSLRREEPEQERLLEAAGALHCHGVALDWSRLLPPGGRCTALPAYPWQREPFWLGERGARPRAAAVAAAPGAGGHPWLGARQAVSLEGATEVWEQTLSLEGDPLVAEHTVRGRAVMPGAGYLDLALSAAGALVGGPSELRGVAFLQMLELAPGHPRSLQLAVRPEGEGLRFQIASRPARDLSGPARWTVHAAGTIAACAGLAEGGAGEPLEAIRGRCAEEMDAAALYQGLEATGLRYGPAFRGVAALWRRDGEALCRIEPTAAVAAGREGAHAVHPAFLDACLQAVGAAVPRAAASEPGATYVPVEVTRFSAGPGTSAASFSHAVVRASPDGELEAEVRILDAGGRRLATLAGLRLHRIATPRGELAPGELADWLFAARWEEQQLAPAQGAPVGAGFVVLGGEPELAAALDAALAARGARALRVEDPSAPGAVRDAVAAVAPCHGVVLLDAGRLEDARSGCARALAAVRALVDSAASTRLWIATRGAQEVDGTPPSPAGAALWGLGRSVALELPALRCGRLDLDPTSSDPAAAARALAAEVCAGGPEDEVAWRGGRRWVSRVRRAALSGAGDAAAPLFSAEGAYLVTGGLGGIGLALARLLVEEGARDLTLVGRSAPGEQARETVEALRAAGARVEVVAADMGDAGAVAALLAAVRARAPLRGVFHAAAVLDDAMVTALDAERVARVLAPKLGAAAALDELTRADALTDFVIFSSAAALLGSPGQASYCAANAAVDALAQRRRADGLPALSIAWGSWGEIGLAAQQAARRGGRLRNGFLPLAPDQGLSALGQLVRASRRGAIPAHLGVMALSLPELVEAFPEVATLPRFAPLAAEVRQAAARPQAAEAPSRERLAQADPVERRRILEGYVADQIARVMGIARDRIVRERPLTAMGIDSLLAMKLKRHIEAGLGTPVPVTKFFQGASVADLTEHLAAALGGEGTEAPGPAPAVSAPAAGREGGRDELRERRRAARGAQRQRGDDAFASEDEIP